MLSIAFGVEFFQEGLSEVDNDNIMYERFITELAKDKILSPPLSTETFF